MKRLFKKFKQLIGYKYFVSCRTHRGYMSSGPFTLKQAKQECEEFKSWNYEEIEIIYCSRVIY